MNLDNSPIVKHFYKSSIELFQKHCRKFYRKNNIGYHFIFYTMTFVKLPLFLHYLYPVVHIYTTVPLILQYFHYTASIFASKSMPFHLMQYVCINAFCDFWFPTMKFQTNVFPIYGSLKLIYNLGMWVERVFFQNPFTLWMTAICFAEKQSSLIYFVFK